MHSIYIYVSTVAASEREEARDRERGGEREGKRMTETNVGYLLSRLYALL